MPNSLNNALNNIDLSNLGMSMNGAPSGGLRLNFNINTLINPNPSAPVGAMTASLHAVKTGVDEKGNDIINSAQPGQITSQYNILKTNKNTKSAFKVFNDLKSAKGFMNSKVGKFGGQYGGIIGDAASAIGDVVGKRGLDGKHGGITKGMDTAYDTIQKAAANFGPYGQIVSAAMGVNKLLGNAVSKIGGGTDGMTKTDAVLNSAFLNMTPLGLINGFGGKKANTYTRNQELDTNTNGGFLGFLTTLDVTLIGAGKKYGLFSSGARNKQNQLTEFTLNMKHTISGIVDTNTINNLAAQGSTPFIANQLSVDLSGGVQQMRAARHGMLFSRRVISKYQIGNKLKRTIKVLDTATNQYVEIPLNLTKDLIKGREPIKLLDRVVYMAGDGTVSSDHWESGERKQHLTPKGLEGMKVKRNSDYEQRLKSEYPIFKDVVIIEDPNFTKEKTGAGSIEYFGPNNDEPTTYENGFVYEHPSKGNVAIVYNPTDNDYEDVKMDALFHGLRDLDPAYKAIVDLLRDYAIANAYDKKRNYLLPVIETANLNYEEDRKRDRYEHYVENAIDGVLRNYFYNGTPERLKERNYLVDKEQLKKELAELLPYIKLIGNYLGYDTDDLPEYDTLKFKQGGQMNVIPEGALHARLNHLDLINDDLTHVTTKGIPVITKEGGEVVQHAEIEHSEIIFTLDVTNKIEDLRKKWHEDKDDKYAIEAGKLLVKEILHNTDDRTNLIESVE